MRNRFSLSPLHILAKLCIDILHSFLPGLPTFLALYGVNLNKAM
jgi:hypothetical protein